MFEFPSLLYLLLGSVTLLNALGSYVYIYLLIPTHLPSALVSVLVLVLVGWLGLYIR